jgi:hypothetical protein
MTDVYMQECETNEPMLQMQMLENWICNHPQRGFAGR